jgi:hypothetical protein
MILRKILPLLMLSLLALQVSAQKKSTFTKKVNKTVLMPVLSDSLLKEQLTRAVINWKNGKAVDTYLALDSINLQVTSNDNIETKTRAAIWTATYLQAQKKPRAVPSYLDSALVWAKSNQSLDEIRKAYEVYVQYYISAGNSKAAIATQQELFRIKDSTANFEMQGKMDSMERKISDLESELAIAKNPENNEIAEKASGEYKNWTIILGIVSFGLLIIVFLLNGSLQRLKNAPPAPAPSTPRVVKSTPAKVDDEKLKAEEASTKIEEVKTSKQETGFPKLDTSNSNSSKSLTGRLSEVELVLIRADALSNYGDQKSIRSLLTEYNVQLPLILKNLDDSIAINEPEPIRSSLEYMKPYMSAFGMQSTLLMIKEVEDEAQTVVKVTKLLSRVFQIRNHCRRAMDESKSLLEKIG